MAQAHRHTPSRRPTRLLLAAGLLGISLLLGACGSESAGSAASVTTTVVAADQAAEDVQLPNAVDPNVSAATASSDAAAAVEASESTTAIDPGTAPPATTAPVPSAGGVTGEAPNGGAVDPVTGAPLGSPDTAATPAITPDPVLPGQGEAILSRPFASNSPWNTPVAGAAVDRRSSRWMKLARVRIATTERPDGSFEQEPRRIDTGLTVNVTRWTVPVFSDAQEGAVQRVAVCRQLDCGPDAVTSVTIPADACPDPRYDGWMTVLDTANRDGLDFWRARCEADGSLSYHYVKRWDLDGPGFQEPTGVSARGSGLPLFAGLITPEEIRDGRIDHALAISVPGAAERRYTQPASRTDGVGRAQSIPEGARIRLRPGATDLLTRTFVRNAVERRAAATIVSALERYGAIVVDRSAAPTMYAQRNASWAGILPLNLVQDIGLDRFEVVQTGPILLDPPATGELTSATASPGVPSSIPATASGSQGSTEFGPPTVDAGSVVP